MLIIALCFFGAAFALILGFAAFTHLRYLRVTADVPMRSVFTSPIMVTYYRIAYTIPCSGVSWGGFTSPKRAQFTRELQITVRRHAIVLQFHMDRRIK